MSKLIHYDSLLFKPICEKNLEHILEIEKEVVKNMSNKNHFGGLGKKNIEISMKNKNALSYGIYDEYTKELLGYTIFTNYELFDKTNFDLAKHLVPEIKYEDIYYYRVIGLNAKARGKGIMGKTINYFTEYARAKNAKAILTFVHPENGASKHNFVKNGFEHLLDIEFDNNNPRNILIKKL